MSGKVVSLGYNLIGSTSGSSGWVSTDLQNLNPLLAVLGNYGGPTQTMALLPGSPAIGKGIARSGVTTDGRGAPRPKSGVDIGAFQDQGYTLSVVSGGSQTAGAGKAFAKRLVVVSTENFANDPLPGATIGFKAPTSEARPTQASSAVTNSAGQASVTATANAIAGSYVVTATDSSDSSLLATFNLSN